MVKIFGQIVLKTMIKIQAMAPVQVQVQDQDLIKVRIVEVINPKRENNNKYSSCSLHYICSMHLERHYGEDALHTIRLGLSP